MAKSTTPTRIDVPTTPAMTDPEGAGLPSGHSLVELLDSLDRTRSTAFVYLNPAEGASELRLLESAIDARPGVLSTSSTGRRETYESFRKLFAGNETMLANVGPEDLPTSVEVEVIPSELEPLVRWAEARRNVFEVRTREDSLEEHDALVLKSLLSDGSRRQWRRLADRLDRTEGRPGWARTAADVIRSMLERGDLVVDADLRTRLPVAFDELVDAADRC